ncbi:MAG TPA: helix-turn-helix transcriptional regulator [Sandaracinaceae bacterium LLY-WYZ-13_1]|nr:helix-turn-helix transcriptional regulator [Sandaracinaceae bacterium LLY-WYZ-13_1]
MKGSKATLDRCALATVAAAYRLEGPTDEWLGRLLEAARPALDRGKGVLGWTFRLGAAGRHGITSSIVDRGPVDPDLKAHWVASELEPSASLGEGPKRRAELLERVVALAIARGDPRALESAAAAGERALGLTREELAPTYFGDLASWGIADVVGAKMLDPTRRGVILSSPSGRFEDLTSADERRWSLVMTHVVAGLRLRRRLDGTVGGDGEAILDPSGRVLHAEGPARDRRAVLRAAARRIDRARSRRGVSEAEATLLAWKGLVSGRWTLVDRFERDGRRYLVARPNAPDVPRPRGLSPRERQIAAYAAMGHSNKRIAYALGLAPSTVSSHLRKAMARLGATDRAQLAALFVGLQPPSSSSGST